MTHLISSSFKKLDLARTFTLRASETANQDVVFGNVHPCVGVCVHLSAQKLKNYSPEFDQLVNKVCYG